MKVLLFTGAGASVELGVPAMVGLATEFLEHARQWRIGVTTVERIMGDHLDIEHLIEELDRLAAARGTLEAIGEASPIHSAIASIRSEVEWFVQHAAERVPLVDATLFWSSSLRAVTKHEFTFVTTNYDRALELAANAVGLQLNDGFRTSAAGEPAEWIGFNEDGSAPPLVKLHGSTDWYSDTEAARPVKLRHPMPLFGGAVLTIDSTALGSALVLPSREKLLTRPPYPRMSQRFLNATDACDVGIFVGSSLRDYHVRDAALALAKQGRLVLVGPEAASLGISGAIVIQESASKFLISTLPVACRSTNPLEWLSKCSESGGNDAPSILPLVKDALDTNASVDRRCNAIERLDRLGVVLDQDLLGQLIRDPVDRVARYALGLVAASPDVEALTSSAEESPHRGNTLFDEELTHLRGISIA